jgi:glutamine amidotransferase
VSGARVVVADLGSGNLRSVEKALGAIGCDAVVTADADSVARADRLVVPGQGAFGACAAGLDRGGGALRAAVLEVIGSGRPFLGICIGMQMLFEQADEGDTPGLGVLAGTVPRFASPRDGERLKVPHMGWNEVFQTHGHALWEGIADASRFYFVHSYYPAPSDRAVRAGECVYGVRFTCAVARDNLFAVQFHPEKSQSAGLQLLHNFVHWRP